MTLALGIVIVMFPWTIEISGLPEVTELVVVGIALIREKISLVIEGMLSDVELFLTCREMGDGVAVAGIVTLTRVHGYIVVSVAGVMPLVMAVKDPSDAVAVPSISLVIEDQQSLGWSM